MNPINRHFRYLNAVVRTHIDNEKLALRNENCFQSYKYLFSHSFLSEIQQSQLAVYSPSAGFISFQADAVWGLLFLSASSPHLKSLEINGNFTVLPHGIFYQAQAGS